MSESIVYLPGDEFRPPKAGDFTIYKYVEKLSRDELEDICGFHKGRLSRGAIVAVMHREDLEKLSTTDFTLGASTRWSRSAAAAPWAPAFTKFEVNGKSRMEVNAIESALELEGKDVQGLKGKVLKFLKETKLGGDGNLPAKVFPTWRHEDDMEYPSAKGAGVPQFKLHNKKRWVVQRIL